MSNQRLERSYQYLEVRFKDGRRISLDPSRLETMHAAEYLRQVERYPDLSVCVCVCRGPAKESLPVSVFPRLGMLQVARQKSHGPLHGLSCYRHELEPQMRKERGWSDSALKRTTSGQFSVQLAFGMEALHEISEYSDSSWPTYWESSGRQRNAITLGGLLAFWLELAGFTEYWPRFGSTAAPEYGHAWTTAFRDAAKLLTLAKSERSSWGLADCTLLPNVATKDWSANNHMALATSLGRRVFAVTEFDVYQLVSDEDPLDLSHVFGVPVEMERHLFGYALQSFPAGRASLERERRTLMFLLCSVARGRDGIPRATVDRVCLQPLTPEGVPCGSQEEHDYFHGLAQAKRAFRVFLRCDEGYFGKRPEGELLDTDVRRPIEVFAFQKTEYRAQIPARKEWYERHFPGLLLDWDPTSESLEDALRRVAERAPPSKPIIPLLDYRRITDELSALRAAANSDGDDWGIATGA